MDLEEFSAEALAARMGGGRARFDGVDGSQTLKERFRRTMFFQEVDHIPNFEFGYWERTLEVWRGQGLPEWVVDERTAYDYFGVENASWVPVHLGLRPVCEAVVLEEDEEHIITRDDVGCVAQINKKGDKSIPHYIDFPVKDRASWAPYVEALDPENPARYEKVDEAVEKLQGCEAPIGIPGGSLVGIPRNVIGFERIAVMPYEDPELFRDIVDTFGRTVCAGLERVLPRIQVDFCLGWEDICFNQGPVVSPHVFDEVAGPWYRRIADLLAQHGCCVYATDTDGNIMPIVDTFMKNGLNTMFPVEVHGGSDPCALRERYGRRIRLWGGVDKMVLIHSKEAIERELQRLKPHVEEGGFIPTVDHRVPADVPLDHYLFYLDRKRELFKVGGEPRY